jgi:hypothetical protein
VSAASKKDVALYWVATIPPAVGGVANVIWLPATVYVDYDWVAYVGPPGSDAGGVPISTTSDPATKLAKRVKNTVRTPSATPIVSATSELGG